MRRVAVLVPVKGFELSKTRLRHALGDDETASLSRALAIGVIEASGPRDCYVVCDHDDIEVFAISHGAKVLRVDVVGLNASISGAYARMSDRYDYVVISHGDLARPTGLGEFQPPSGVTIVTDRHGRGTNVLALPTGLPFAFAYGEDSAAAHSIEAVRLGLELTVIHDSPWALDVDDPEDFQLAQT